MFKKYCLTTRFFWENIFTNKYALFSKRISRLSKFFHAYKNVCTYLVFLTFISLYRMIGRSEEQSVHTFWQLPFLPFENRILVDTRQRLFNPRIVSHWPQQFCNCNLSFSECTWKSNYVINYYLLLINKTLQLRELRTLWNNHKKNIDVNGLALAVDDYWLYIINVEVGHLNLDSINSDRSGSIILKKMSVLKLLCQWWNCSSLESRFPQGNPHKRGEKGQINCLPFLHCNQPRNLHRFIQRHSTVAIGN